MNTLQLRRHRLTLDRPRIMGIVNLTDDSFSGDGLAGRTDRALAHAWRLIEEGADLLDLGAESSRPGAEPVPAEQELERLLPVLAGLQGCGVPLSVDTTKPEVMLAALDAGVDLINDIAALRAPGALEILAQSEAAVCLMHMQGEPRTMQQQPAYRNVVAEVHAFLAERIAACQSAGIARQRIVIDPGFGFGKTLEHNLALLRALPSLHSLDCPLLVGLSRKSMLGALTGRPVETRLPASVAAALLAAQRGARILRVHDVAATRDALAVWQAVENEA